MQHLSMLGVFLALAVRTFHLASPSFDIAPIHFPTSAITAPPPRSPRTPPATAPSFPHRFFDFAFVACSKRQ